MPKVHRYVITNVPMDKQREVFEALFTLLHTGIIKSSDIHIVEEERRT